MYRLTYVLAGLILTPSFVLASTLYIDPSIGTYGVGDTFVAQIRLNTEGDCVNAGNVTVVFPKDTLKAVDFSRGESIFSLWVEEPKIDNAAGTVSFSGGIPGGYCGRIQGDPGLSNILGKIIFTIIAKGEGSANVVISPQSMLYANDGLGTKIIPTLNAATFTIVQDRQIAEDAWFTEVKADKVPPEAFNVDVESTRGVFGGKYYAVFSTQDKQSGLDHYELLDGRGWIIVKSPYLFKNQTILSSLQVRAIDKAGNIRMGTFVATSVPSLQTTETLDPLFSGMIAVILIIGAVMYLRKKDAQIRAEPADPTV